MLLGREIKEEAKAIEAVEERSIYIMEMVMNKNKLITQLLFLFIYFFFFFR